MDGDFRELSNQSEGMEKARHRRLIPAASRREIKC